MTLLCKKKYCCEIQRSENRMANLAAYSEEGYGSKVAVLPMMMMFKPVICILLLMLGVMIAVSRLHEAHPLV
jgi:hypothetical protein